MPKAVHEELAVGQPRERVVEGLPLQLVLGALASAYVLDLGYEVERPAFLVAHQRAVQEDPHHAPVLAKVALLHLVAAYLAPEQPPGLLEILAEVLRVGYVLEALLEQFPLRVADYLAQRTVDPQPPPVRPDQRHPHRRVLERVPEPPLALPERPLGLLAPRDVAGVENTPLSPDLRASSCRSTPCAARNRLRGAGATPRQTRCQASLWRWR